MTILVPFDGRELSKAALVRASALGDAFDEAVVAVTIVPKNDAEYARERGWLGPNEEYDDQRVVGHLREQVADVAPAADFRHEFVDRYASTGTLAKRLRKTAREADASLVSIGSDNAGRMVSSIHSVGSTVAADDTFDVLIVRRPLSPTERPSASSGW